MLVDALKKANRRLGVEIISDTESSDTASDSDLNTDENVNTRHYQLDAEFAKKYYFITNVMSSDDHSQKYFSCLINAFKFSVKRRPILFGWRGEVKAKYC